MDDRVVVAPTATEREGRAALLALARRRGFRRFALPPGEAVTEDANEEVLLFDGSAIAAEPGDPPRVAIVRVGDPEGLATAVASARAGETVAIRWEGDRSIPTENAVAHRAGRFRLWIVTDRPRDVPGALGALEAGADRVVIEIADPAGLDALAGVLEPTVTAHVPWELVRLRRIVPAGLGDRVIVDTTSLLAPEEGLLVGSAAGFLFHVPSEAEGSRFTRPRPFRVNAGAAHSYVLLADGTTRYLSELAAADAVLVARPGGTAMRAAHVGRLKIERRPLVLVEAERGGRTYTLFLQEAETVRLSSEGRRTATTALTPGTMVYGAAFAPARHLGHSVPEAIDER